MVDGSLAYTTEGNAHYTHQLDANSGLAESSPAVIAPDTNPGDKRWILQEPNCRSQLYEASRDLRQKGYGLDIDSGVAQANYNTAANRYTIETPDNLKVDIDGTCYVAATETEISLNTEGNWDDDGGSGGESYHTAAK